MTFQAHPLAAAFGALIFLSSPASAQSGPEQGSGDGMGPPPSLADIPAWADRLFGHLDADRDAVITGGELAVLSSGPAAAMGGGRLRRMIAQSDSSNDGRISRDELIAGTERMFNRMDADGDGTLSEAERPRPPAPPRPPSIPMPQPDPMPMPDMSGVD